MCYYAIIASMSEFPQCSIPVTSFYGDTLKTVLTYTPVGCKKRDVVRKEKSLTKYPFKYLDPQSPSSIWKVFRKQEEAILLARERMNGVLVFVCQSAPNGDRSFLVAHPSVFWFYDCRKDEQRSSYEIICENSLCKLYFDLEFCKETNCNKDGVKMTETFIKMVSYFLFHEWKIVCSRDHILDLDSSTDKKFSRHLIFQLPYIFKDNYHVGNFVKMICHKLQQISVESEDHCLDSCGVSREDLMELFINDKENKKLFCDVSVYSKNRHFRLFNSTKWNKKSYLTRSEQNKWLTDCDNGSEKLFLDSLITYIPIEVSYTILTFSGGLDLSSSNNNGSSGKVFYSCNNKKDSPYPDVDNFIRHLVSPGVVYRWLCCSSQKLIYYDIVGNRYCRNIGREHKSNNIRFVVDLKLKCLYQKCYDPDCSDFRSENIMLPAELIFSLEGPIILDAFELSDLSWNGNISEEDLEILDCVESCIEYF